MNEWMNEWMKWIYANNTNFKNFKMVKFSYTIGPSARFDVWWAACQKDINGCNNGLGQGCLFFHEIISHPLSY